MVTCHGIVRGRVRHKAEMNRVHFWDQKGDEPDRFGGEVRIKAG